ncbi:hypothetical protein [Arthrobacter sp. Rue61a]|uniref:hypothetical protein n=1 Tax=Arthrobacter sp. Rue61a TaxID=1118963 RepID=UPI00027DF492|nr:hypothetical protein [Arthrobacter sp. Rue61a]AFR31395.1 hypothetical protein ARUE_232p01870 [Arthrobacter sp. Rue61a]
MARPANDRAVAARDFLIKRLDGYAPTGAMVTELRRFAEKYSWRRPVCLLIPSFS